MQTSPLQLDEAFVGEVSIRPNEPGAMPVHADDLQIDAVPSYARNADNPLKWMVKLAVKFSATGQKPVAYEGHINCEGYFTVADPTQTEEKQRKLVAVNAATILYSTAREIIAGLTARARNGKLLLPSVSFIDQVITFPDDPPKASLSESDSLSAAK